jgi:NADH-quinone oxidoreductase subunit J
MHMPLSIPLLQASTTAAALFYICAAVIVVSALSVVVSRNIVRTAVGLLFTLVGVAGMYLVLGAEFLAAVQLLVYAGGTLILIVFGVMLTSMSTYRLYAPKRIEVVLAICIGLLMFAALVSAIVHAGFGRTGSQSGYVVEDMGKALLGDYLVPFELISVLLLVVMIGAAYLAKSRKHQGDGN